MILVTGASGYLGRHVADRLLAHKLSFALTSRGDVGSLPCDLRNAEPVYELLKHLAPTVIIHCAAVVPKASGSYADFVSANASALMMKNLAAFAECPIIFASSLVAANRDDSEYAHGKWRAEQYLRSGSVSMRLPGLFGLPRRSGVIYEAARMGAIPASFGPYPAMHVADAAEYLVRAATMPSDGNREPFSVTYGDPRLEACYGSLGMTFQQRVRELVETLRKEAVPCGHSAESHVR